MGAPELEYGMVCEIGDYRESNEDRVHADGELGLFIVADGMGGQAAGELASQTAVEVIAGQISERIGEVGKRERAVAELIRNAVLEANEQILSLAERNPLYQSMGTTVVLALIRDRTAFVAGLGDSPALLIRRGKCKQLTTDHSLAQALHQAGSISAEEVKTHRFRNVLWRYLGTHEVGPGPDIAIVDLKPGDWLVLASDGLTGVVELETIAEVVKRAKRAQAAADRLLELALENGSRDNISCIAIKIG
jgi:protein phosphatase